MLLLLLACADTPSVAGYRVTTTTFNPEGLFSSLFVEEYDDDGNRALYDETGWDGRTERVVTTWDDGCPVRSEQVKEDADEFQSTTWLTTCDEHRTPVLTERAYTDTLIETGETWISEVTIRYTNTHDEQGRLVRQRTDADDGIGQIRTYGWGDCDEPTFYSYLNDGGDSGIYNTSCREDGQTEAAFSFYFDDTGALVDTGRVVYGFDTRERETSRVYDSGDGTEVTVEYNMTWGERRAPGPTSATMYRYGELYATWTFAYERLE